MPRVRFLAVPPIAGALAMPAVFLVDAVQKGAKRRDLRLWPEEATEATIEP